jgi:uncharacterized protein (DUF305 family)
VPAFSARTAPAAVAAARHPQRRLTLTSALAAGALAVVLTGCGSGDHDMSTMPAGSATSPAAGASGAKAAGPAAPGPRNDADIAFATGMIPHHAQAVQMADLALQRGVRREVKDLAAAVKAAQGPEITQLSGWLSGWGKPVPATDGSMSMDHGAGGHGGMVGMMSDDEMKQLAAATGASFDTLWLQMMIKHHEGAVTMAQTQLAEGENPAVKALAQTIASSQAQEIATMKTLLG